VIDIDQGHSGASAADREGFQQLVAEVSLGRAGIVLGLECSRLARNSADWHQLLELCAMTGTLICDEDGLYDPRSFNDRLLLGLKGTMAESLCRCPHKSLSSMSCVPGWRAASRTRPPAASCAAGCPSA
jgi:DNA invertase Pin-like site-specific DNA recombinase